MLYKVDGPRLEVALGEFSSSIVLDTFIVKLDVDIQGDCSDWLVGNSAAWLDCDNDRLVDLAPEDEIMLEASMNIEPSNSVVLIIPYVELVTGPEVGAGGWLVNEKVYWDASTLVEKRLGPDSAADIVDCVSCDVASKRELACRPGVADS